MPGHRIHLRAGELQAYRPVQNPRGERRQQRMRPDVALAAEPATEKPGYNVDLLMLRPPPRNRDTTLIFSSGMPSTIDTSSLVPKMCWVVSKSVSMPSLSQTAVVACGSIWL